MYIFFGLITLLGVFICPISFIIWLILKIRKKNSVTLWKYIAVVSLLITMLSLGLSIITSPDSKSSPESKSNVTKVDKEKKDKSKYTDKQSKNIEESIIDGHAIKKNIPIVKTKTDPFVKKLMSFGFTEDEAINNAIILKKCGIPSIKKCKPTDPNATIDGLISYRWKINKKKTIIFTVENRKIFYVALNGEDLYDEDKGGYLKNFDDVHIPKSSISASTAEQLRDKSESVLDNYFTKTRYFDAWAFGREDEKYMVQCQATDGSISTDKWIYCRVWYEQQPNGTFVVTGVQIDGQQYELK